MLYRSPPRPLWRLSTIGAVTLSLAGCDDLLTPDAQEIFTATEGLRPSAMYSSASTLTVPPTNSPNNGAVGPVSVSATGPMWVRLSVPGSVALSHNAEYLSLCSANGWTICPPPVAAQTVSPAGIPVSGQQALRVSAKISHSWYTQIVYFGSDGAPANGVVYVLLERGAALTFSRSGITGANSCFSTTCDVAKTPWSGDKSYYDLNSSQQMQVEQVQTPIRYTVKRHYLVAGDTARLQAVTDMPLSSRRWFFVPGDTLASASNPTDLMPYRVAACEGLEACKHVPPRSGRFYVRGSAYGLYNATNSGDPVWVGKNVLELTCNGTQTIAVASTPAPPEIINRGDNLNCSVTTTSASATLVVQRWTYTFSDPEFPAILRDGDNRAWNGIVVKGGVVSVSATLNGAPADPSLIIDVRPRPWGTLQTNGPINIGNDNLRPPPSVMSDLANTDIRNPTSYPFRQVSGGPNDGLRYLELAPPPVEIIVRWNDAWNPSHSWYQTQVGGPHPSGGTAVWCDQSDMPGIEQRAREHEGLSAGPNPSHVSVVKAYFSSFAQPATVDTASPQAKLERIVVVAGINADSVALERYEAAVRSPALADPKQGHYDPTTSGPGPGLVPLAVNFCHLRY